jgi:hypothetical protein
MTQPGKAEKIPFTLHLSADVARRLMQAAETQKKPAADLAAELLDQFLPRAPAAGQKKGNIPYS